MARKDALLRLHKLLVLKRDALRKKLADDYGVDARKFKVDRSTGDVGDAAIHGESDELNSQIAAFESRELYQIERALHQLRNGRYGCCESCDKAIPIARLNALPFTPLCIDCQRLMEDYKAGNMQETDANWEVACELEGRFDDRELSISDFDFD